MSTATSTQAARAGAPRVDGKFLEVDGRRFLVKGVAYGTFAPASDGSQFPQLDRVAQDFAQMAAAGINTVRTYTVPSEAIVDEAARHGLRLMVGIPWSQHISFLDDRTVMRQIRGNVVATVKRLGAHPAALLFAVGNEIPAAIVRWHGQRRVERFLRDLYLDAKAASPSALLSYVNFPPTEYLDLDAFDVCAFNVYLHREVDLRAYLAKLQHLAGNRPLLLAEAGADSIREGDDGQARITAMHLRAAFAEGACGAVAFSWTDEWWRGGHDVTDWKFGLVDDQRRPKPALAAVSSAFADAPFAADERARWPKVSVVVCAYNASETIDDCLSSLSNLAYPSFEVIVINDGSRDDTGDRARRYPIARVVDVPNGGLSAARNLGIEHASGEIVAYTDADVRVDADWLSHLVQPILTGQFVGSGGPNVVPPEDPLVAQCVARAPGGPTQVLLSDRVAEHVPGCNMAFRREALLAIGGFNPVYLRAGDDVDVCWRLQAKGLHIGFAPSALVWHHHRATVKAYWRQQVGYGEGETWLDAHHPEKFIRGQMLWRGHIYSSLPFVRSFTTQRINTGVWGTAAFPSVYRTDVNAWQFLPHSTLWILVSSAAVALGLTFLLLTPYRRQSLALLSVGVLAWATTVVRCAVFASRTDVRGLANIDDTWTRYRHRALIMWLHLIQPVARAYGRVKGMWSPPDAVAPQHVTRVPWKAPVPSPGDAASAALVVVGGSIERAFWSERWTSNDAVLTELAGELRAARPTGVVDVDDGWHPDRDLSVAINRWGWLRVRAVVEEHAGGKCLLRIGTRLQPSFNGVIEALVFAVLLVAAASAAIALRWPELSLVVALLVGAVFARTAWHATRVASVLDRALGRVTATAGMVPLDISPNSGQRSRIQLWPATRGQAAQAALMILLVSSAAGSGVSIVRDVLARERARGAAEAIGRTLALERGAAGGVVVGPSGDLFLADGRSGLISRLRARSPFSTTQGAQQAGRDSRGRAMQTVVSFDSPSDIALAPDGDIFVADALNHRICRIDSPSGRIVTIAGSGVAGYDGDDQQATQASLSAPSTIALARNGDLFIADTNNHRVRVLVQATGLIRTVAGDGTPGAPGALGDGGPAASAHLSRPSGLAVAPNGDLYIADTGHHRVRKVDVASGVITTVAGVGLPGMDGDEGPAIGARLASPMGLALVPVGRTFALYVADSQNGRVRMVRPDGTIGTLGGVARFTMPVRLAYHSGGWLYVKDASPMGVTLVPNARLRPDYAAVPVRPIRPAPDKAPAAAPTL